jgi:long-chain acyl-CoA synthetase
MPRDTLLDFFEDFSAVDEPFIVHDDGYRVREATYRQVAAGARAFAARLSDARIGPDDRVVIWSENRAEWIVALWGTLLIRAVLVPVDYRASSELVARIVAIVRAKVVLVGAEVPPPEGVSAPIWRLADTAAPASEREPSRPAAGGVGASRPSGSSLAEIIFTSGATAEPKGVTITHKNVLANIVPIEREVKKYLLYERPFHPIRFLNLLPMSHLFGQSMATFVPPMIRGTVVFSHGYSPTEIVHQIRSRRVSVLVCVPKVLQVLREHLERVLPETSGPDSLAGRHFLLRWWRYRRAHRLLGWKFWCVICGAAPLEPDLENFWRNLGFLVIQGYGLTETAPIVTLNHPFKASKGSVGTAIGGVTVMIADDGEVLVRGDNVTTGYYDPTSGGTAPVLRDGWFHTGDIGEMDASGRLQIKGRKKEMIATAQGMKVFPEDVERVLTAQPGVTDAAVVGVPVGGEERVHAVLILEPGRDAEAIVRRANLTLEDHQRVWSSSIWPGAALPRTDGTEKLKRHEIRRWAMGEAPVSAAGATTTGATFESVVGRFVSNRTLTPDTTLDELGLSSLDRVELMMALEEVFRMTLDETDVSGDRRLSDLRRLLEPNGVRDSRQDTGPDATPHKARPDDRLARRADGPIVFPSWNRGRLIWWVRRLSLPMWILPLGRIFMQLRVDGLEHLADLEGPIVLASNHQSHMDTPAIMLALPARRRDWLATAMAKEFFTAHFNRREYGWRAWFTNSLNYYLACAFFNTFPLPQREAGARQTLRYIGEIAGEGYSILIFPEGRRAATGAIDRFRPGVGMIAARLDLPVVPVRLEGLEAVLHQKARWPTRGPVRVTFGAALRLTGDDYEALAQRVEGAVKALGGSVRRA